MKKILLIVVILSFLVACGAIGPRKGDVIIYNKQCQEIEAFTNVKIINAAWGSIEFEMDGKRFVWTGKFDIFYKK